MKVGEFFDKWNDYVKEFDRNLDNKDVDIEDYELVFEYQFYQHFEYKIDGIEVKDGKIILKSKTKITKEQ